MSKATRADLHEQLATWILDHDADRPDVDKSLRITSSVRCTCVRSLAWAATCPPGSPSEPGCCSLRWFAGVRLIDLLTARQLLGRAARLLPIWRQRGWSFCRAWVWPSPRLGTRARPRRCLPVRWRPPGLWARNATRFARDCGCLSSWVYRTPTDGEIERPLRRRARPRRRWPPWTMRSGRRRPRIAVEYLAWMRGDAEAHVSWALAAMRHATTAGRPERSRRAPPMSSTGRSPARCRCAGCRDRCGARGPGTARRGLTAALAFGRSQRWRQAMKLVSWSSSWLGVRRSSGTGFRWLGSAHA